VNLLSTAVAANVAGKALAGKAPSQPLTTAGKTKEWLQIGLYLVIAFVIYKIYKSVSGGISAVGEGLGIIDTVADKAIKEENKNVIENEKSKGVNSIFSPKFWPNAIMRKKKTQIVQMDTVTLAEKVAKEVYNSVGDFYDKPSKAVTAFAKLNSKISVSFACHLFEQKNGIGLLDFLADKFDTATQAAALTKIIKDANQLPTGLKTGTPAEIAAWANIRTFLQKWTGIKLPA